MWKERMVLLFAGIHLGIIGLFKYDVVNKHIQHEYINRGIHLLFGLAAFHIIYKNGLKPAFLDRTILPTSMIEINEPSNYDIKVKIKTKPNVKVIYWASNKNKNNKIVDWKKAYGKFENSGIVKSNSKGIAVLKLQCPQRYTINKFGVQEKVLDKHVHYRISDGAFLSEIYTKFLENECK